MRVHGLDVGEWKSAVAERQEADGARKLVLVDPPLTGFELLTQQQAGRPALVIDTPQLRYVLERQQAPSAR